MQDEEIKPFKKCENCNAALYCEAQKKCVAEMLEDPSWRIVDGVHVHCKSNDKVELPPKGGSESNSGAVGG